jgi:hypothetical protein
MSSMQVLLPVVRHTVGWSGHGLVERMVMRRDEFGTVDVIVRGIVVEPVFARLEAVDHRVACARSVLPGVLGWR